MCMCVYVGLRVQWRCNVKFIYRFCFNPFLPPKSKNSHHAEICASASVSNSSQYGFLLHFLTVFSCPLWHFYCRTISDKVTRRQIDFKRWEFCDSWESYCFVWVPWVVFKVVHGHIAPNISDVCFFLMVYREPYAAFLSLSRRLSGTAMSLPREPASAVESLRWV